MKTPAKSAPKGRLMYTLRGIMDPKVKQQLIYGEDQFNDLNDEPVFVLPADPQSVEAMEMRAHEAIANDPDYQGIAHHQYLDLVGTVFKAIGLIPYQSPASEGRSKSKGRAKK